MILLSSVNSLQAISILSGTDLKYNHLLYTWVVIMISAALICFFVSEITQNYSQVDKLWSLMPIVYSLVTLSTFPSVRVSIMAMLVSAWGLRLSYNFYRKGGYNIIPWKGEEDYRWKIMRQNPALIGRFRFGLFNFFFISIYQHLLILLISTPLLMAAKYQGTGLNAIDLIAAYLVVIFLVIETVADNQLFRFHQLKKHNMGSKEVYRGSLEKGFLTEGLWRFSRHPNFAAEQAIWISFWLFGVAASGRWINWTLAGPVLLILLFQGSSRLTERISSSRYPDYAAWQKTVPRFFRLPNTLRLVL
jgi:steroid 5-alpha reductase family enzyme